MAFEWLSGSQGIQKEQEQDAVLLPKLIDWHLHSTQEALLAWSAGWHEVRGRLQSGAGR